MGTNEGKWEILKKKRKRWYDYTLLNVSCLNEGQLSEGKNERIFFPSFIQELNRIKIIKSLNAEGVIKKKGGNITPGLVIPHWDLTLVDFSFWGQIKKIKGFCFMSFDVKAEKNGVSGLVEIWTANKWKLSYWMCLAFWKLSSLTL